MIITMIFLIFSPIVILYFNTETGEIDNVKNIVFNRRKNKQIDRYAAIEKK